MRCQASPIKGFWRTIFEYNGSTSRTAVMRRNFDPVHIGFEYTVVRAEHLRDFSC